MHQALPPLAEQAAAPFHSLPPEDGRQEALQRVRQSAKPVSDKADRISRGVAETSAEAVHSLPIAAYLQPKERAVMALFTGPEVKLSRQQISELAPMPLHGVCGRVDSLLAAGRLEECGDRIDPLTHKRQKLLQMPRAAQRSLFREGSLA